MNGLVCRISDMSRAHCISECTGGIEVMATSTEMQKRIVEVGLWRVWTFAMNWPAEGSWVQRVAVRVFLKGMSFAICSSPRQRVLSKRAGVKDDEIRSCFDVAVSQCRPRLGWSSDEVTAVSV